MRMGAGQSGGLLYLELVRPDAPPDQPLIVLLHGRGASAEDLVPLAEELGTAGYRFVFPNGRLRLEGLGWDAYAWYELERVARDLPASRAALEALLAKLWAHTGLGPAQTVLVGFSQGAVLALDVGLRAAKRFAGLVAMSGYLYEDDDLAPALSRARDQRVLIVHGQHDPLLPLARAQTARRTLEAAGLAPEYHEFPMGHEVSAASLAVVATFVHQVLPPRETSAH